MPTAMTIRPRLALLLPLLLLLAACGPVRHVFPPDVGIQQLRGGDDGRWTLTLRLNNTSYDTAVRFQHLDATLTLGGETAGRVDARVGIDVAARSADVFDVTLQPGAAARAALAALGNDGGRSLRYALAGTVTVSDEHGGKEQRFTFDHDDALSPVPGIPDTYR